MKSVWDKYMAVPRAPKSVWDLSHTSHMVAPPMMCVGKLNKVENIFGQNFPC